MKDERYDDYQSILYNTHSLISICLRKSHTLRPPIEHSHRVQHSLTIALDEIYIALTYLEKNGEKYE
mgnify:CR=1 FL=1